MATLRRQGLCHRPLRGDLRKGIYRLSKWDRLSTQAVVNDDGTPIGSGIEAKLDEILTATNAVLEELKTQTKLMKDRGN